MTISENVIQWFFDRWILVFQPEALKRFKMLEGSFVLLKLVKSDRVKGVKKTTLWSGESINIKLPESFRFQNKSENGTPFVVI